MCVCMCEVHLCICVSCTELNYYSALSAASFTWHPITHVHTHTSALETMTSCQSMLQTKSTDARCRPKAQMHAAGQKHRCMLQARSTDACCRPKAQMHVAGQKHRCTLQAKSTDARCRPKAQMHVAGQKHRCTLQAKSTDACCRPIAQMHVAGQKHRCMLQAKSTDARLQIPGQAKATCSRKTYQLILAYHIIKRPLC